MLVVFLIGVAGLIGVAALARAPAPAPAGSTEPTAAAVTPEQFGAQGDGTTDDTAAVQAALDSLSPGGTLLLADGRTYRHATVVRVTQPGVTIRGTGTMLAGAEAESAVYLAADDITVDGPTFAVAGTTGRWVAFEQMKLRLGRFDGITVRNVTVSGSAAAGIYVGGATHFELSGVTVRDTRADGIHITGGARDGTVTDAQVINPGDDGVAVVSYRNDGDLVSDITVESSQVVGQIWGRGFSVVGGSRITYRQVTTDSSAGAGIYIAAEKEFDSYGVSDVLVDGATLVHSNQQAHPEAADRPSPQKPPVVHGAVLVYCSQPDGSITDVSMRNLALVDTVRSSGGHVRLVDSSTSALSRLAFESVAINGGSDRPLATVGVESGAYRATDWVMDGNPLPDHIGW